MNLAKVIKIASDYKLLHFIWLLLLFFLTQDIYDFPVGISPTTHLGDTPLSSSQTSRAPLKWDYGADLGAYNHAYSQTELKGFSDLACLLDKQEEQTPYQRNNMMFNTGDSQSDIDDTDGIWTWPTCQQTNYTQMPKLLAPFEERKRNQLSSDMNTGQLVMQICLPNFPSHSVPFISLFCFPLSSFSNILLQTVFSEC